MTRSEIDRRARRTVTMQYVSEIIYEPDQKHHVRCDCSQCRAMWRQEKAR